MTVDIDKETSEELDFDYTELIKRVVRESCSYEDCPFDIYVNVLLTDNAGIRELNREYRGIDTETDVLSFPALEYDEPSSFSSFSDDAFAFDPDTGLLMIGDIAVSIEKVREQALKYGHSTQRELGFLIAHSMLHLFGYDHMEDEERAEMERRQSEILENIGLTR